MIDTNVTDFVPASGGDDTENLKSAIARMQANGTPACIGTVFVAGEYTITEPLVLGVDKEKFVCLKGLTPSRIQVRIEEPTDEFALTFLGTGRNKAVVCENLRLDCHHKSRGIAFKDLNYQTLMSRVYICDTRQCALYTPLSWGSRIEDSAIRNGTGFGWLGDNLHSCHVDGFRIANIQDAEDGWPDDLCTEGGRATVFLLGGTIHTWTDVKLENNSPTRYPLIRISKMSQVHIGPTYCEGNTASQTVVVHDPNYSLSTAGNHIVSLRVGD